MHPKPRGWSAEYAAWFQDPGIVRAYPNRPPYPDEAITFLVGLIADQPRAVLDVGCGTGDLARRLAPLVDRVDAVDVSLGMIEQGRRQPGGDHSNLRWIHVAVEHAPIQPPYALVTAGESLHWMDWEVVLPRLAASMSATGFLAIVERDWDIPTVVGDRLRPLFARYAANRDYKPLHLIAELETRDLFAKAGEIVTNPAPWRPTPDEYVEMRHSQNSFSRERMGPEAAAAFDREMRQALSDLVDKGQLAMVAGQLELQVRATIVWGKPRAYTR